MIGILVLLTTTTILCKLDHYNYVKVHLPLLIIALCSGSNFVGPRNITRGEGTGDVTIPCQLHALDATPFWKINSTIYYYSDMPPPFEVSTSGREVGITAVDLSLNGTSFQCFIPSVNGLITSSIGILTVIDNGIIILQ